MDTQNNQQLTKKERKALRRQEKERQFNQTLNQQKIKKIAAFGAVAFSIAGLIYWGTIAGKQKEESLPGESFPSQGEEHIQDGTPHPAYNSNPPTSGWHYSQPAKAGFYEEHIADETLLHNLEHGHIVISYNCEREIKGIGINLIPTAYADHPADESADHLDSADEPATHSSHQSLPESFNSESCNKLKEKLENIIEEYQAYKVVAVPRPENETLIALTAWTRLQKLDSFDEDAIKKFVKAYRNRGPERTPE